jgi:glutathione S-transferase
MNYLNSAANMFKQAEERKAMQEKEASPEKVGDKSDYSDMKITLFYDTMCKSCQSIETLIDISGIKVEKVKVSLLKRETQSEWFKKMNPQGKVPCLQVGDNFLVESSSLLRFIGSAFNMTKYYPSNPTQRHRVDSAMDYYQTTIMNPLEKAYYYCFIMQARYNAPLKP